ncbi:glycosyltransferase family 4 protein [Rhodohalobacter sp. 8-1]|uniref:glycosyltransferase family 4 protein n=1 Tax=Rhodohalobacter sp. 8-1 TaxID=3131972 RepID=UPI0030EBCFC5
MGLPEETVIVYNDILFLLSQTFMYEQVKVLAKHCNVHLMAKKFENPHKFNADSFERTKIDQPHLFADKVVSKLARKYYDTNLYFNTRTLFELRSLLKKKNIKAIHAHFGPRALEILGIAKKHNIPLVVTFHGYDASTLLRDKEYREKLPALFDYASKIIVVSRHMIDTLNLDEWLNKVHVIPCSVDSNKFSSDGTGPESGKVSILHAGRIAAKKGVPDLIRVFKKLSLEYPDIELHIAGDGKQFAQCRELVKEYSLEDRIHMYGAVSHEKVKELISKSDIFVLNSRVAESGDMEGTPVTILEAMSMEKAVVSTRHAGIPHVIDHGKNGLLAEEKDNEDLRINLKRAIESEELRLALGKAARKTIVESFSSKKMEERIHQVFEDV